MSDDLIARLREAIADMDIPVENDVLGEAADTIERLTRECHGRANEMREAELAAGRALGYPAFKDDQKNFPGATDADGVCIGDHVTSTIVQELADAYVRLTRERGDYRALLDDIYSWLVCFPIASAEDMAQSFPTFLSALEDCLRVSRCTVGASSPERPTVQDDATDVHDAQHRPAYLGNVNDAS